MDDSLELLVGWLGEDENQKVEEEEEDSYQVFGDSVRLVSIWERQFSNFEIQLS